MLRKQRLFLLVLFFVHQVALFGAKFVPLVRNFTSDVIVRDQAFACTQNSLGKIYIGASGVIEFDGTYWGHYKMPGDYIVRGLLCDSLRLYAGSYEEFGYFEPLATGELNYRSLSRDLDEGHLKDAEIWQIEHFKDKVLFRSFGKIFVYDGKQVKPFVYEQNQPVAMFASGGKIIVQSVEGKIFNLDEDMELRPIFNGRKFGRIVKILHIKGVGNFIIEANGGINLIHDDDKTIKTWPTEADSFLKQSHINDAIAVDDSLLVFGTSQNGVMGIALDGKIMWHHNYNSGLCNNGVLSLFADKGKNIWCTTDQGLSLILVNNPCEILMPAYNHQEIGVINDIAKLGNNLYLATSQGLFTLGLSDGELQRFSDVEDYMWHISAIDNRLFAGGNTHLVIDDSDTNIFKDHSSTKIIRSHDGKVYYESGYNGLRIYNCKGDFDLSSGIALSGLKSNLRNVIEDVDGALWAEHMACGIFRIEMDNLHQHSQRIKYFKTLRPGQERQRVHAFKMHGQVFIANSDSIYYYSRDHDNLQAYSKFSNDLPWLKNITAVSEVDNNTLLVASLSGYSVIKYDGEHYVMIQEIPTSFFSPHNLAINNKIYVDNENNIAYLTANNSVLRYVCADNDAGEDVPAFSLSAIYTSEAPDKLLRLPLMSRYNPSVDGNIKFRVSFLNMAGKDYKFRYTLYGDNQQSDRITSETLAEYAGLSAGEYLFHADLLDANGVELSSVEYSFNVPRPLLLRSWMIAIYIVLFICGAVAGAKVIEYYRIQKERKRRQRELLVKKVSDLQEENGRHLRIQAQLEENIKGQSGKLVSIAMHEVARSEKIEDLKKLLDSASDSAPSAKAIERVMQEIQGSDSSQDFWTILQNNFDLVHDNYFANLRKSYPALTPVDLRFCAMLRFNMSTKDMAHLLNLSVRGVETARYRLRRKFNLAKNESLTQFLIDFNVKNESSGDNVVET